MKRLSLLLLVPLLLAAKPPPAPPPPPPEIPSVRLGVQKWQAGDYPAAVTLWTPFAANGDMDALFNLGQAYKLGRGVPKDLVVARDYYRKAATKGSLPAQANLGILLYQAGEKPEAFRWLAAAADRGETRAQYVLGVAAYNGDGVRRNVPLGYAYLLQSSRSGLALASNALPPIAARISPIERMNGETIAASLAAGQGVPPAFALFAPPQLVTLPAVPLPAPPRLQPALPRVDPLPVAPPAPKPAAAKVEPVKLDAPKPVPVLPSVLVPPPAKVELQKPVPTPVPVIQTAPTHVEPPKVELAKPEARIEPVKAAPVFTPAPPVTEIAKPAAPLAAPVANTAMPAAKPLPPIAMPATSETAKPVAPKPAPKAEAPKPKGWRVQLGAYATRAQADKVWAEVKVKQAALIAGTKPQFETSGTITKLQIGPLASRDEARTLCAKLSAAGRACFIAGGQ